MAEDKLKKYDRGADGSVSGGGIGSGVGMSRNGVENSTSASENGAVNSTSMSGNGPVGAGEGLEGASGAKVEYEEGFGEKAQDGALGGVEKVKLAGKAPKKAYIGAIVALAVVILAAVGITVAVIWGSKELVTEVVEPEEPVEKDEIEELSLDDEVVQEVWKNIKNIPHDVPFAYELADGTTDFKLSDKYSFYGSEGAVKVGITDRQKLALALYALQRSGLSDNTAVDDQEACKVYEEDTELIGYLGEAARETGYSNCIRGESVRKMYKEIFGDDTELTEGHFSVAADGFYYSTKSDGYFLVAGRGGSAPFMKELYRAERDGQKLYLYEAVAINSFRIGDEVCYVLNIEGERITDGAPCSDAAIDIVGIEGVDRYKWTFRKNEEGNYIFEGLEKVN